jgi:DNA mismatch endonuclease (patch repair protein)
MDRDAKNLEALSDLGWKPIVIWECETKDNLSLTERLKREIGS